MRCAWGNLNTLRGQFVAHRTEELCRLLDGGSLRYEADSRTDSIVRMIDTVSSSGISGLSKRPARTQRATSAASKWRPRPCVGNSNRRESPARVIKVNVEGA